MVRIISTQGIDKDHYYDRTVDGIALGEVEVNACAAPLLKRLAPRPAHSAERVDLGTPVPEVDL